LFFTWMTFRINWDMLAKVDKFRH